MDIDAGLPWWAPAPSSLVIAGLVCRVLCLLGGGVAWRLRSSKSAAGLALVGFAGMGLWGLFQGATWSAMASAIFEGRVPLPFDPNNTFTVVMVVFDLPFVVFQLCLIGAAFVGGFSRGES